MRIVLTGGSGFIGSALNGALATAGHEVVIVSRSRRPGTTWWDPERRLVDIDGPVDVIIHLAGESIGERWTAHKKVELVASRVSGTDTMAQLAVEKNVRHLLSGSAIGYYGSRGDEELTEAAPPGDGFLADLVVQWEGATEPAIQAGIPVSYLRSAVVLDTSGGSFPRMALPFRFGVGGKIASGSQWFSWISLRDEVRAIMHILDGGLVGPFNISAPEPVPNRAFSASLGKVMGRPSAIPVPAFALKLLLGAEFAEEVLLASQRVVPEALLASGFDFLDGELESALAAILA